MPSQWMQRALQLAKRGQGKTSPNPMVGAVVVAADGTLVGEGYHHRAGAPHAEVEALAEAGARARGGTLYVTLEPCNHYGRTPPCTEAILNAGLARVMYAVSDPNPQVEGHGAHRLAHSGVQVDGGDGEADARALNAPFFTWATRHRPLVTVKSAASVDGRVRTVQGQSKYLTGAPALKLSHRLRRWHDAILVGTNTVIADDPQLTDRTPGAKRQPVRVIVDSHGRTPAAARMFQDASAPTLVFASEVPGMDWEREIFTAGGEVIRVASDDKGRPDLAAVFQELGRRRVLSVLVDGGPTLVGECFRLGLADRWVSFVAPLYLGGPVPFPEWGAKTLASAPTIAWTNVRRVGADVMLAGDVHYPGTPHDSKEA